MANTRAKKTALPLRRLRCGPPPDHDSMSQQEIFRYLFAAGDWTVSSLANGFVDGTLIDDQFVKQLHRNGLSWLNAPSEDVIKSWTIKGSVPKGERREALFHVIEKTGGDFASDWITALVRSWGRGHDRLKIQNEAPSVVRKQQETPNQIKVSRYLSLILRHKPDSIGLEVDVEGWVSTSELIAKSKLPLSIELIERLIHSSGKTRFALTNDRKFIRALYGHSIDVEFALAEVQPPEILYHGTQEKNLDSIQKEGISSQKRRYVHLSVSVDEAISVASRRGLPVVLEVQAGRMAREGFKFFQTNGSVWLVEGVNPEFIRRN